MSITPSPICGEADRILVGMKKLREKARKLRAWLWQKDSRFLLLGLLGAGLIEVGLWKWHIVPALIVPGVACLTISMFYEELF